MGPRRAGPLSDEKDRPGKPAIAFLDKKSDAIGVVRIEGLISMSQRSVLGDNMVDRVKKNLEKLLKKRHVKAVILQINSPGGTVASSQELYRSIYWLRQQYKKPVIALLGDVAASGGYYVASACDKIVAQPGTITGSIGVIFQTGQFDGLLKRFGVSFNTIKSGTFKDIGNPTRPMLAEEKAMLQNMIDTAYAQFVRAVSIGRSLPLERVRQLADGRIYLGEQALNLQLIDAESGFAGAVAIAKQLARIEGEPRIIWEWDLREELLNELFGKDSAAAFFSALTPEFIHPPAGGLLYLWPGY
ncbi:MAG: signal peptide peptidase SppA [Elusimicrobia bacterium]|nr:signal peptide peptidase SppA [Elusimicrobiota bacterium]